AVDGTGTTEESVELPRRTGAPAATPITTWLGELAGPVGTYHQSLVVRTPAGFRAGHAERVVRALPDTHDVLRFTVPGDSPCPAGGGAAGGGAAAAAAGCSVPSPGSVDARGLVDHVRAPGVADAELPALTGGHIWAARRPLSPADGVNAVRTAAPAGRGGPAGGRRSSSAPWSGWRA
ncbi:hypothetical protein ACFP50_18255, partial [Streptomyces pratens]